MSLPQYWYRNITGTTAIQLATGAGLLHSVTVNRTNTSPIAIVDRTADGGTIATIATLKASVAEQTFLYDCVFSAGLRINQQSDSDTTITWSTSF